MMVFLVTIFAVIAFDTNMAIHNRILAQNAVDSAAESAALWQARGCNLEQQLNNLHYDVDEAACIAEGVAAGACIAAITPCSPPKSPLTLSLARVKLFGLSGWECVSPAMLCH